MITRHFLDLGGQRVHYRRSGHGPPVVLLHESPRSSAALVPLMQRLSPDLTVFALDTAGYGQSDKLAGTPGLSGYAETVARVIAALGLGRVPVYGTHTGASIAFMVAAEQEASCSLAVLDGFPVFSAQEREEALANYLPPFLPAIDGTHLAWLWSRVRDQTLFFPWYRRGEAARLHLPLPPPDALQAIAMDTLRAGDGYRTAYAEAFSSRPLEILNAVRAPVLFGCRMDDVLLGHLDRLPAGLGSQMRVERFPADREAQGAVLRARLLEAAAGLAPAPTQAPLPQVRVGCAYLETSGGALHLRGSLGGAGRPLLLLHPLPGSSLWFEASLAREAGKRPVLAPDLPGAGDSDAMDMTPETLLDLLEEMLARLGITEVEIAGLGTGAILAKALQARAPGTRSLGRLADLPSPDSDFPEFDGFRPHRAGAHLTAAWLHVRDEAILGPWTTRQPPRFDTLDADLLHRRAVEIIKARGTHADLVTRLLA
jgi:pimeloyl-ACP methyl ester carboxylesterase